MRTALLLLCAAALAAAQIPAPAAGTVTFSPQQSGSGLMLWAVDIQAPGRASIPAAQIYALAAAHGVGHVDANLANTILTTKASSSVLAIGVKILGAGSALAAVASVVKNGGVVSTTTASKIQNGAIVGAGVAAIALPYLEREQAATPNPVIAAQILTTELKLGASGLGSALFYSTPVNVGAFVEKLP